MTGKHRHVAVWKSLTALLLAFLLVVEPPLATVAVAETSTSSPPAAGLSKQPAPAEPAAPGGNTEQGGANAGDRSAAPATSGRVGEEPAHTGATGAVTPVGGAVLAISGTQVGGTISSNTTWTAVNSPYVVISNVTVNSGVRLAIEPGVVVKFQSQLSLIVNGTLTADATPSSKIAFTSIKDDTFGGDTNGDATATVPAKADWSQISFGSSSVNSVLDNCIVKYGGYVTSGKYGVISVMCPALSLTDNLISTNNSYAVYCGYNTTLAKSGNSATDNGRNGVYVQSYYTTTVNTTWQGSDLPYIVYSFTVGQNKTHTIAAGTVVKFESYGSVAVYGTFRAIGTSDQRVTLTSVKDDSYGGDTNNDSTATVPARGNWYYVKFNDQSIDASCRVELSTVRYGGAYQGAIWLSSASPQVTNCVVEESGSSGLYLDGNSQPSITQNTVRNSSGSCVYVTGAAQPTVSGNTLTSSRNGVYVNGTAAPSISGNTIGGCTSLSDSSGVYLAGTGAITISGNTITANNYGVYATGSSTGTVAQNTISNNAKDAAAMAGNSMLSLSSNFISGNARNGILLSGNRSSGTLPAQEAPYTIDSFGTTDGSTVTLESGSIFKFVGPLSNFIVRGTLLANGVTFTSMKDDARGGDTDGSGGAPAPGDWYDINLREGAGASRLENCGFYYGGNGSAIDSYGAIRIDGSSPSISQCRFEKALCSGIYVYGINARPTIVTCTFIDYGVGVSMSSGAAGLIDDNTISGGVHGIKLLRSAPLITGNTISGSVSGIQNMSYVTDPVVSVESNTFSGNTEYDIDNWPYGAGGPVVASGNIWGNHPYQVGEEVGLNDPRTPAAYNYNVGAVGGKVVVTYIWISWGSYSGTDGENLGCDPHGGWFAEPIHTPTGNFTATYRDLRIAGKGFAVDLKRTYNSQDNTRTGGFGHGWTHTYEQALCFHENGNITALIEDGRRQKFTRNSNGTYASPSGVREKLVKNADNTYSYIYPDGGKRCFSQLGILTSLVDRFGNTTTLEHNNPNHLVTRITAPGGAWMALTYSGRRVTRVEDSGSRSVQYGYNSSAELTSVTDVNGKTVTYTYDGSHRLLAVRAPEPSANPFLTNHYANGRVDYQDDAFLHRATFDYDTANRHTDIVDNKGGTLTHRYDSRYRLTQQVNQIAGIRSFTYTTAGFLDSLTDENSHTSDLSYDANKNVTEVVDGAGHSTKAGYDLTNNNCLWTEDASGSRTTYTYDETGKYLTSMTDPVRTIRFESYSDGLLKDVAAAEATTTFEYNAAGNLTKIIDPLSKSTSFEYSDGAGRVTKATDANGHALRLTYNNKGRITNIKDPLAETHPSERHEVDFTYDDNGNLETFTDAVENTTTFMADDMNHLSGVVDAAENTTTYSCDPNYNLSQVTDANGYVTTYDWWPNNLLKAVRDPLNNLTQFDYDPAGNLTDIDYPNGKGVDYTYTDDNLIDSVSHVGELTTYSLAYTPTHLISTVTDNMGRDLDFGYNPIGWLTEATDTVNPDISGGFVTRRSYDELGRTTGVKTSSEDTRGYEYNARGDLTTLALSTDPTSTHTTFSYDDARQRTKVTTPDGSQRGYNYTEAWQVASVDNTTSGRVQHFGYEYDPNGNVTSENDARYGYDELNRLATWYDPSSDTTTTYNYDPVGNLTTVTEGTATVKSFTYNAANRITNTGFSHDEAGNMTSDGVKDYVYDSENRLKEVKRTSDGQTIASYDYDVFGRRIKTTDASGTATYFHYDGTNVIAESDGKGTITSRYVYDDRGQLISTIRGGEVYYYQFNGHGDVVSLTDDQGQIANEYRYDPWGKVLDATETVTNPYRYAGYRHDQATGLYYLWHRYYSPELCRFLTKDLFAGHLTDPKTLNPYAYALDNPATFVDPFGLWSYSDYSQLCSVTSAALGTAAFVSAIVPGAQPLAAGLGVAATGLDFAAIYFTQRAASEGEISCEQAAVSTGLSLASAGFGMVGLGGPLRLTGTIISASFDIGAAGYSRWGAVPSYP